MGRKALGSAVAKLAISAAFFVCTAALGQPAPEPVRPEEAPIETPAAGPEPAAAPAPAPARSNPPPLDPPPPSEPVTPPAFLRSHGQLEDVKPRLVAPSRAGTAKPDFLTRASPWVDFSFTSFYLEDRVGNFLNFGAQVGGYFFEHLRLSARLVAPTEEVRDGLRTDSSSSFDSNGASGLFTNGVPSRSMSLLYGASAGLVLSNDRSFVFGPSLGFLRTDVGDYGTAVVVGLPFEWTTRRNLRVGFEISIGHASGGTSRTSCATFNSGTTLSCGVTSAVRPGGTAVLISYNMGWALGRL